jgi:hypothetical protein
MNIVLEVRGLLEAAGFRTSPAAGQTTSCYFEDENIMGSVTVHESAKSLLTNWEKMQDAFLGQYASQFRSSPAKAWNIYTIHLTTEPSSAELASKIFEVEHDFRGTRKIARTGIISKEDLRMAILPLLPLQNMMILSKSDFSQRIRERLSACHPILGELFNQTSPLEISRALMEAEK